MMRAIVADRAGAPAVMHDIEVPMIAIDEILVRVRVAGVNPLDWKLRDNAYGGASYPMVLGQDFAGVVERAGSAVAGFAHGDRVFGSSAKGSYADFVAVKSTGCVDKIPAWLDDARAAALPTAGLTALHAVEEVHPQRDNTVLIVGATGGVGGFAVQIARSRGAHVIATAHSGKEAVARAFGADEVVPYDRGDLVDMVKRLHPAGVDAIIDVVSDTATLERYASLVQPGGRVVSTIRAADPDWFARRNIQAVNFSINHTPTWSRAGLERLLQLVQLGAVVVRLEKELPINDAERVLADSKAGRIDGKAVLTL